MKSRRDITRLPLLFVSEQLSNKATGRSFRFSQSKMAIATQIFLLLVGCSSIAAGKSADERGTPVLSEDIFENGLKYERSRFIPFSFNAPEVIHHNGSRARDTGPCYGLSSRVSQSYLSIVLTFTKFKSKVTLVMVHIVAPVAAVPGLTRPAVEAGFVKAQQYVATMAAVPGLARSAVEAGFVTLVMDAVKA
jgi:hypothetical protein